MNESYYVFNRYSLYRASVLACLLPLAMFILISLVNHNLYDYVAPFQWFVFSSIPLLFIGYKIKLQVKDNKLLISRCFFNLPLFVTQSDLCSEKAVFWERSQHKNNSFCLIVNNKKTSLFVDK